MEGIQFNILLMLYYSSLKLISFLKAAMYFMEVCFTKCIDGVKLPNEYLTIRPGSVSIYMWPANIPFEQRMLREWARLETFHTAPETLCVWIIKLAKYGFYYTGFGNKCKCAFCGLVYEDWSKTDDPEDVHRTLRPNCPLVHDRMNTDNITIAGGSQGQSAAMSLGEFLKILFM
jgi:hypothetical protein